MPARDRSSPPRSSRRPEAGRQGRTVPRRPRPAAHARARARPACGRIRWKRSPSERAREPGRSHPRRIGRAAKGPALGCARRAAREGLLVARRRHRLFVRARPSQARERRWATPPSSVARPRSKRPWSPRADASMATVSRAPPPPASAARRRPEAQQLALVANVVVERHRPRAELGGDAAHGDAGRRRPSASSPPSRCRPRARRVSPGSTWSRRRRMSAPRSASPVRTPWSTACSPPARTSRSSAAPPPAEGVGPGARGRAAGALRALRGRRAPRQDVLGRHAPPRRPGGELVAAPPVLFLDEPTTGLDPKSRRELWDLLRGLVDEGTTLVLTTQYLEEAD